MTIRVAVALAALAIPSFAHAQNTGLDEMDLVVRKGELVEAVINDQTVRFRVAPDAISVPTVNADTAERLGLEPSLLRYGYMIGPVKLSFTTDTVRYHMDGDSFRRRTAYSEAQIEDAAEGVAGPATFPYRRTVLVLRDPQPGDRAHVFPIDDEMGRSQTGTEIDVGGPPVYVAFSFDRAESLVSATGGRWIADAHGGWFDGDPRETRILYGVDRPTRSLRLGTPLMLGELEVRNLAVRVADMGSANGIAEGEAPERDPNEIVVTGEKGRIPRQRMYLGMDTIGHCASIAYDFDAETITLMCPDQPAATATDPA